MFVIAVEVKSVFAHETAAKLRKSLACRVALFRHGVERGGHRERKAHPLPRTQSFEVQQRVFVNALVFVRVVIYEMQRIQAHDVREMPMRFGQTPRSVQHHHAVLVDCYVVELVRNPCVLVGVFAQRFRVLFQRTEQIAQKREVEVGIRLEIRLFRVVENLRRTRQGQIQPAVFLI